MVALKVSLSLHHIVTSLPIPFINNLIVLFRRLSSRFYITLRCPRLDIRAETISWIVLKSSLMAAKCPGQGAPPETSSEDTAIKHRKGASWDTCNDARYPQITEETESEDEEESTEASEDEYMDEGLGRRVKAVLKGFDKPYNPDLEPAPNLPVYHPSFAKVEYIYSEVVEDAINLLKLSPYKDSQTEALVEYMAARRKIVYSKVKIISMIGDSGVGMLFLDAISLPWLNPF